MFFSLLGTIPLNFPMWYYALANGICTDKSVDLSHLSWSCFILGNK